MKKLILAAAALLALAASAQAQQFPTRPVTLIVPWPPGGSTDIAMRALATATEKHLGQSIVIENRPGAAGTLGPGNMAANGAAGRLHGGAIPDHHFPHPVYPEDGVGSRHGLHLRHPSHRLHVRRRGAGGLAVQDVQRHDRARARQSRQGQLRDARRRHEPAHHHGADRQSRRASSGRRCRSRAAPTT